MTQSKVSMVVPCYNKEKYIDAMLRSVCEQLWDNVELILVNDGSTDRTRDIIEQWKPKIVERGYELVIIDQENSGCCAAVLSGLERMTGDYFCLVDCDDEIRPEYVSRMAGWLDAHGEYEWACCSYQIYMHVDGEVKAMPPAKRQYPQDTEMLLEKYIFRRVITMAWIYMSRVSYVQKCGMIDKFCAERRATYEPLIVVPLAVGGGRIKFFDEPLYKYNMFASDLYKFNRFKEAFKYYDDYLYLYNWVIDNLDAPVREKNAYKAMARLAYEKELFMQISRIPDGAEHFDVIAERTASLIDELFAPPPSIPPRIVRQAGFELLFDVLEDVIYSPRGISLQIDNCRRIIAYGAMGKTARKLLPKLADAQAMPELLWDAMADEGAEICEVPVYKPDFQSLNSSDVVVVFPKDPGLRQYVREHSNGAAVINIEDIFRDLLFPVYRRLFAGCEFLPQMKDAHVL